MKELKNYFILIISILIVCVLFLTFTKPQIEEIQAGQSLLADTKGKLINLTQKAGLLSSLDENNLTEEFRKLNFILPSEKNVDGVMFSLERTGEEASVSVVNVDFSPGLISTDTAAKKNVATVQKSESFDLNFIVETKLEGFRNFLRELKNSSLAIKIEKVSIEKASVGQISAKINAKVFYKPINLSLGDIFKPLTALNNQEKKILQALENSPLPEVEPMIPPLVPRPNPFLSQ